MSKILIIEDEEAIADFHLEIGQLQIIFLQISNCLLVFNNQNLAHKNTSQILIIGII